MMIKSGHWKCIDNMLYVITEQESGQQNNINININNEPNTNAE